MNGDRFHHSHRCSSVIPAIRAIKSDSAGHTYRNGAVNSVKLPSGSRLKCRDREIYLCVRSMKSSMPM